MLMIAIIITPTVNKFFVKLSTDVILARPKNHELVKNDLNPKFKVP